jgi:hypothetical protein
VLPAHLAYLVYIIETIGRRLRLRYSAPRLRKVAQAEASRLILSTARIESIKLEWSIENLSD